MRTYSLVTAFDNVIVLTLQRQQEMGPLGLHLLLIARLPVDACAGTPHFFAVWTNEVQFVP